MEKMDLLDSELDLPIEIDGMTLLLFPFIELIIVLTGAIQYMNNRRHRLFINTLCIVCVYRSPSLLAVEREDFSTCEALGSRLQLLFCALPETPLPYPILSRQQFLFILSSEKANSEWDMKSPGLLEPAFRLPLTGCMPS